MTTENEWVRGLVDRLKSGLASVSLEGARVTVACHRKLPYAHEVFSYTADGTPADINTNEYETDLLITDEHPDGKVVPRVVNASNMWRR